jgi:hypothetical protein
LADKSLPSQVGRRELIGESTNTASPVSPQGTDGRKRPYLIVIAGAHVGELHKIEKARSITGGDEIAADLADLEVHP